MLPGTLLGVLRPGATMRCSEGAQAPARETPTTCLDERYRGVEAADRADDGGPEPGHCAHYQLAPDDISATARDDASGGTAERCSGHPSYRESCLPADVSDVDCAGSFADGLAYTRRVEVVAPDEYDLDRDGDGLGCESS